MRVIFSLTLLRKRFFGMVHKIRGKVVRGNSIGRKLGFLPPTFRRGGDARAGRSLCGGGTRGQGHFTGPWSI